MAVGGGHSDLEVPRHLPHRGGVSVSAVVFPQEVQYLRCEDLCYSHDITLWAAE